MRGRLRIVKVGGSLLEAPDLVQRLRRWLQWQPAATSVLLAGGGCLAEQIRRWDELFSLGQQTSHWLCVDLLDVTARMLNAMLPEALYCREHQALRPMSDLGTDRLIVFAPARFLREDESDMTGMQLPHSWDATSDSIAARLAEVATADELVLLKSSLPSAEKGLTELAGDYVDRQFLLAADRIPQVRFVNLRDDTFPEVIVRQS